MHGLSEKRVFLINIAAEDGHAADSERQREEGLVHRGDDDRSVDLGKIRDQIEGKTFFRAGKRQASARKHEQQDEQRAHHIFRYAFQTVLQIEAQNDKSDQDGNKKIGHIDPRIGDHGNKSEILISAGQELYEIVNDPAGDHGVEGHQCKVADQAEIAERPPFAAFLLQRTVDIKRAGLGGTSHRKFHDHDRQSQHQQADDVHQHEASAAVLSAHPGELPDISAADRAACGQHDEA